VTVSTIRYLESLRLRVSGAATKYMPAKAPSSLFVDVGYFILVGSYRGRVPPF